MICLKEEKDSKKIFLGDKMCRIATKEIINSVIRNYNQCLQNKVLKAYVPKNLIKLSDTMLMYDYVRGKSLDNNYNLYDNVRYVRLLYDFYKQDMLMPDIRRPNVICNDEGIYIIDLEESKFVKSKIIYILKCLNWIRDMFTKE